MEHLSADGARRIALAAQGFNDARPTGHVDRRHARRVFDRIGLVQIDSVNVVVRSQELPIFARLGPHPRDLLARMAADGELFEYWGHAASLMPIEHYPLFGFQRAMGYNGNARRGLEHLELRRPGYVTSIMDEVKARGPITAGELSDGGRRKGTWWDWSDGKRALEYLLWSGELATRRRAGFEREYDLAERIIPPAIYARPSPPEHEARAELLALGAKALGVATFKDLADYYRLSATKSKQALHDLVEAGRLVPVRVEGWPDAAYLDPAAKVPRRVTARALLSPFDSLVWERARTERIWDFHYRLEIYTPAPKRQFGYYVLPFLLGEEIVARVDLKADRAAGLLRVPGAFAEPGIGPEAVIEPLAEELRLMAGWLGLGGIAVGDRGDLVPGLAVAVS